MPFLVFVGTYTEPIRFGTGRVLQGKGGGIHAFAFADGRLHERMVTAGARNPSFLAPGPDGRYLYCVNELKEWEGQFGGAVSAFRVDGESGALTLINTQASLGTDPCHLILDPAGKHVLVANFAGGSVTVLPVRPDGGLEPASQHIQHEGRSRDPVRQAGPHAHAVAFDLTGHFVFVPDLGLDKTMIYVWDGSRLTPNPNQNWAEAAPGAGPRQLAMHPGGRFAYVINELDSTISVFRYDPDRGRLDPIETLPTLPAGFTGHSTCAEVQVHPSGRFLYGSNRGHDSIVTYAIDTETGHLTPRGHTSSGGRTPRHFTLSPDGAHLLAVNQDDDNLVVFRVDVATGALTPLQEMATVGTPICVRFASETGLGPP